MARRLSAFVGWAASLWRTAGSALGLVRPSDARDATGTKDQVDDLAAACLRGIRVPKWVEGSVVLLEAFMPDTDTASGRPDGGEETSINWEDDGTVLERTQKQQNAQHGVARVPRGHIDWVRTRRQLLDAVTGERARLPDNPHHGNLVFRRGLSKALKKQVANALALEAEHIAKRQKRAK